VKLINLTILFLLFLTSCMPPGTEGEGSTSGLIGIAPFVIIFLLFYLLILRPQQKQNRQRDALLKNLKRGDKIVTSGGLHGRITTVDDEILTVEIAKGVNVQVSRSSVTATINPETANTKTKK